MSFKSEERYILIEREREGRARERERERESSFMLQSNQEFEIDLN
jgi:hypothetical protein